MHKQLAAAFREIEATHAEAGKLAAALELAKSNPDMLMSEWGWITVQGFASAIEKIYAGCERALEAVARHVDQHPIADGPSWHRDLLVRMANPFDVVRPRVLSAQTAEALDLLRSFRHRARNTYGSVLDIQRVLEIAADATVTPKLIEDDLISLSSYLSSSKT
jgi:hypothetical protein